MPDAKNSHTLARIIDFVKDAVISNAYAPIVFRASQFMAPSRAGIVSECFDMKNYAGENRLVERLQVAFGGPFDQDLIHARRP